MSKIKLLYALESAGGGSLKHVVYLGTLLDKNLFDITVVLPCESYERDTPAAVLLLRKNGVHVETLPMLSKGISPLQDFLALFNVYFFLRRHRFDVVHAHSSKAGFLFRIASLLLRSSVVMYTPHCFYFMAHSGFKRRFYAFLERFLAKLTDCIVISGTEESVLFKERIKPLRGVFVIDNALGEDFEEFKDVEVFREFCGLPLHHKIVVGVGRLVKQKNWDMFLSVASLVLRRRDDVSFLIAGNSGIRYAILAVLVSTEVLLLLLFLILRGSMQCLGVRCVVPVSML